MKDESLVLTKTRQQLLSLRRSRAVSPSRVYSLDTIKSAATVLSACGGQAALVFRAVIGSYWISRIEQRTRGFTIHPAFRDATGLPARQLQRATKRLEEAGYIVRYSRPGRKVRICLTKKGIGALVTPSSVTSVEEE